MKGESRPFNSAQQLLWLDDSKSCSYKLLSENQVFLEDGYFVKFYVGSVCMKCKNFQHQERVNILKKIA